MCVWGGMAVYMGLVIIARKGITTHLILGPDNHQQNVSWQSSDILHMELDVKGKKLLSKVIDQTQHKIYSHHSNFCLPK